MLYCTTRCCRDNPMEPQILLLDDLEALQQSNFDATRPNKMIAHGHNGDPGTFNSTKDGIKPIVLVSTSDLTLSKMHIFDTVRVSDTRRLQCHHHQLGGVGIWRLSAGRYCKRVNRCRTNWVCRRSKWNWKHMWSIGHARLQGCSLLFLHYRAFVDFLVEKAGAPLSSFHLIGFSLGAHVVGGAGAAITSGTLPRITGNKGSLRSVRWIVTWQLLLYTPVRLGSGGTTFPSQRDRQSFGHDRRGLCRHYSHR